MFEMYLGHLSNSVRREEPEVTTFGNSALVLSARRGWIGLAERGGGGGRVTCVPADGFRSERTS